VPWIHEQRIKLLIKTTEMINDYHRTSCFRLTNLIIGEIKNCILKDPVLTGDDTYYARGGAARL
jgi:hypothetical protein